MGGLKIQYPPDSSRICARYTIAFEFLRVCSAEKVMPKLSSEPKVPVKPEWANKIVALRDQLHLAGY